MKNRHTVVAEGAVNVMAAVCAVVVATGVLAIVLASIGAVNGYTISDMYAEAFPRFRGGDATVSIPRSACVTFFLYIVGASGIALRIRRGMSVRSFNRKQF